MSFPIFHLLVEVQIRGHFYCLLMGTLSLPFNSDKLSAAVRGVTTLCNPLHGLRSSLRSRAELQVEIVGSLLRLKPQYRLAREPFGLDVGALCGLLVVMQGLPGLSAALEESCQVEVARGVVGIDRQRFP